MTRRKQRIGPVLLIILGTTIFFLLLYNFQQRWLLKTLNNTFAHHFGAGPKSSEQAEQQEQSYPGTWEQWIDEQTKIARKALKQQGARVSEEYIRGLRNEIEAFAAKQKKTYPNPPPLMYDVKYTPGVSTVTKVIPLQEIPPLKHDGPQTSEALMHSFDEEYSRLNSRAAVVDEKYPRADWIAMLLERGHIIEDSSQYSVYLNLRHQVVRMENNPELGAFEYVGISPTNDFEAYRNAFIDRKAWEMKRVEEAETADPDVSGGYFPHSHPDVFLPFKDKRVYVRRNGMRTSYFGEMLTEKQEFDIVHKGIHPEGIEIIYIDNDYNVVSEKPATISREDILKASIPPPEFWEDGVGLTQEKPEQNNERQDIHPQETVSESRDIHSEAAQNAQKQFEEVQREALKHITKTDAEIEAELEKLFTPQVPTEKSIETSLQERFSIERFNRAIKTLNRYGPEEGLRRIKDSDPEVAKQIERLLQKQQEND